MRRRVDLLAALAALLFAWPALAASWPDIPEPEGAQSEWVAKDMLYNGLPMRISRFTSTLPVSSIVSYYNREWPGQTVINEVGSKTVIGHAHGEYYVTIEVSAKGGSQSQIGITRLLKRKPDAAAGADFPKPSGTQVINDITYLDTPGRSLSMESTLSPFQTDAFYASRLPRTAGAQFRPAGCSMIALQCVVRYSKGSQEMTMTFNRHEQEPRLSSTSRSTRPPP
jgi:hypothetical protein